MWSELSRTWVVTYTGIVRHTQLNQKPWLLLSQLCIGNSSQYNAAAYSTSLRHSFLLAEKRPWSDIADFPCRYGKPPHAQELLQQKLPRCSVCKLLPQQALVGTDKVVFYLAHVPGKGWSALRKAVPIRAYFQMSSFSWCFGSHKCRQALGPHLSGPSTSSAFNLTSHDFLPEGLTAWKRLMYQI